MISAGWQQTRAGILPITLGSSLIKEFTRRDWWLVVSGRTQASTTPTQAAGVAAACDDRPPTQWVFKPVC